MRARAFVSCAAALAALVACGSSRDVGTQSDLRVEGATFIDEDFPAAQGGPAVDSVTLETTTAVVGSRDEPLRGVLAQDATAVAIAMRGDRGYWLLRAGVPGVGAPDRPTFTTTFEVAKDAAQGAREIRVAAAGLRGVFGEGVPVALTLKEPGVPEGALVVSLAWDTNADLDLHVVLPNGVEVFKRNVNSYEAPPPSEPPDPTAWMTGGSLDADSNAACVIDGLRRENFVFAKAPLSGHYVVRVDTFSMCREVRASWRVDAWVAGAVVARASGSVLPSDTRFSHDRGAGVFAVEFDVP